MYRDALWVLLLSGVGHIREQQEWVICLTRQMLVEGAKVDGEVP